MPNTFFISDTHFGHANIIRMCERPFVSIEEMDRTLIENWNARVSPDDDVYHLGDFAYRAEKSCVNYLKKLNGHIHLVIGNHDYKQILKQPDALAMLEEYLEATTITLPHKRAFLCHYPLAEPPKHVWIIHGHVHNTTDVEHYQTWPIIRTRERTLNASVEVNNYMPVTFDELLRNNQRWKEQH